MRVAALLMVRDEQHVVATCIGHLLTTLGVDRVYVVDNGSTDRTPAILRRIAADTGRVAVETDPGPYRQAATMTSLARRAIAEGADWVLPLDADEFLWLSNGASLRTLCAAEVIGGYRLPVCNFMQARLVRRDRPGALLTMCVAAVPFGSVGDGEGAVTAGRIPFLRINYPPKVLLRATPSLGVTLGNHDGENTSGPLVPLEGGALLHAPIRSWHDMEARVGQSGRVAAMSPEPGHQWHAKRVATMSPADLQEEWRRNSFDPLRPVRRGVARLDWRLVRIGLRQAGFRRRAHRT